MAETRFPAWAKALAAVAVLLALVVLGVVVKNILESPETQERVAITPAAPVEEPDPDLEAPRTQADIAPAPEERSELEIDKQQPRAPGDVDEPDPEKRARMVQPGFFADLARYLVSRYHPGFTRANPNAGAVTTLGFKELNTRYGRTPSRITGMRQQAFQARRRILDALLGSGTLKALYRARAEDFIEDLAHHAGQTQREYRTSQGYETRTMSSDDVRTMLLLYADQAAEAADVFSTLAADPGLFSLLSEYLVSVRAVNAAYAGFWEKADAGGKDIEDEADEIKSAIQRRERLKTRLTNRLAGAAGTEDMLQRDDMVYLAQWAGRRVKVDGAPPARLRDMAWVLEDLAGKLRARARR